MSPPNERSLILFVSVFLHNQSTNVWLFSSLINRLSFQIKDEIKKFRAVSASNEGQKFISFPVQLLNHSFDR